MSDDTKLLLNQYFSSNEETSQITQQADTVDDISETSNKISSLKLDDSSKNTKNEPEVCRIFAETPPQPKDPTAAFFDLIGSTSTASSSSGIITDFGIPSGDVHTSIFSYVFFSYFFTF